MTTLPVIQAIRRHDHHFVTKDSAAAAYACGDVVVNCVGDGRTGIVAGLDATASGAKVTFQVEGVYDVLCASATTFSAGDLVFWDDTNNIAKTTATGGYLLLGRAVRAKVSGELIVRVSLNPQMRMVSGEVTGDGSNPTTVVTGLSKITSAVVSLKQATAPGDDPSWISCNYSGTDGNLDVYFWKNTGGTDPTLVASTTTTAVVSWVAFGV